MKLLVISEDKFNQIAAEAERQAVTERRIRAPFYDPASEGIITVIGRVRDAMTILDPRPSWLFNVGDNDTVKVKAEKLSDAARIIEKDWDGMINSVRREDEATHNQ
jgi:hypothetical protein